MCSITSLVFALSQLLAEVGVKARVAVVLPQFGTESLVKKISRCVGWSNEKLEYVFLCVPIFCSGVLAVTGIVWL